MITGTSNVTENKLGDITSSGTTAGCMAVRGGTTPGYRPPFVDISLGDGLYDIRSVRVEGGNAAKAYILSKEGKAMQCGAEQRGDHGAPWGGLGITSAAAATSSVSGGADTKFMWGA